MNQFKTNWISVFIREFTSAIGVLALVLLAFSHQPIGIDNRELYRLGDGSIPVFCGSGPQEGEEQDYSNGCEACRITSGIALPNAPCDLTRIISVHAVIAVFNYQSTVARWSFNRNGFPRAPPVYI